jgi:hypothetical protein
MRSAEFGMRNERVAIVVIHSELRTPHSALQHGLMVQREDTSSADWKSGFDPRWVHFGDTCRTDFQSVRRARVEGQTDSLTDGLGNPSYKRTGHTRKVAGYGWPGRFAKPCDREVVWVQIPCLPLVSLSPFGGEGRGEGTLVGVRRLLRTGFEADDDEDEHEYETRVVALSAWPDGERDIIPRF